MLLSDATVAWTKLGDMCVRVADAMTVLVWLATQNHTITLQIFLCWRLSLLLLHKIHAAMDLILDPSYEGACN